MQCNYRIKLQKMKATLPWLAVATKQLLDFPLTENSTDTPLDTGAASREASMTDRSDLTLTWRKPKLLCLVFG
jgi:hypothetical protein